MEEKNPIDIRSTSVVKPLNRQFFKKGTQIIRVITWSLSFLNVTILLSFRGYDVTF